MIKTTLRFTSPMKVSKLDLKEPYELREGTLESANMVRKSKSKQHTFDYCMSVALKYKTVSEWSGEHRASYSAAQRNGWLPECTKHMIRKPYRKKYTLEHCMSAALKYYQREDWKKADLKTYGAAQRNGWLPECTKHMGEVKRWTKRECIAISKKYNTRSEWSGEHRASYSAAQRYGWLPECTSHMPARAVNYQVRNGNTRPAVINSGGRMKPKDKKRYVETEKRLARFVDQLKALFAQKKWPYDEIVEILKEAAGGVELHGEKTAEMLGLTKSMVSGLLKIAESPEEVRSLLSEGVSHAAVLALSRAAKIDEQITISHIRKANERGEAITIKFAEGVLDKVGQSNPVTIKTKSGKGMVKKNQIEYGVIIESRVEEYERLASSGESAAISGEIEYLKRIVLDAGDFEMLGRLAAVEMESQKRSA